MRRMTKAALAGIGLGTALIYLFRWYAGVSRVRGLYLKTENFDYSNHRPEELASSHLTDLNSSRAEQFSALGISAEAAQRILDNRPYRNKLDLLSRMVLSRDEYAVVKDKVSVSEGRDAIKIA